MNSLSKLKKMYIIVGRYCCIDEPIGMTCTVGVLEVTNSF